MAMIDYGAVVFKNGFITNECQFFMDMQEAVGWVDRKRIRYEDCDHIEDGCSRCCSCPRRTDGITDCNGASWAEDQRGIDGNWFAYIGDKEFTVAVYKTQLAIFINGKKTVNFAGLYEWSEGRAAFYSNRKVVRLNTPYTQLVIRQLANMVYHAELTYKGDHYHIIYGAGVDSDPVVWHDTKHDYHMKREVKRIESTLLKIFDRSLKIFDRSRVCTDGGYFEWYCQRERWRNEEFANFWV